MKKFRLLSLILAAAVIFQLLIICIPANAQKAVPAKKDEMTILEENINHLTKKVYSSGLFSAEDSDKLIEIRMKLNDLANGKSSNAKYAKLFYQAAFIFNEREYKQDAIQYFSLVTKNFPGTVYAKRAKSELEKIGVVIENTEEDEE